MGCFQLERAERYLASRALTMGDLLRSLGDVGDAAVILGGSIASGRANALSDIDLILVGARSWRPPACGLQSGREALYRLPGGQEVNVELWDRETVLALGARLRRFRGDVDRRPLDALDSLTDVEAWRAHALTAGIVLRNGALDLGALVPGAWLVQERIVAHLKAYLVLRESANRMIGQGQDETAAWTARLAVAEAAMAVLASIGEVDPREKWLLENLRANAGRIGERSAEQLGQVIRTWPREDEYASVARGALRFADRQLLRVAARQPETRRHIASAIWAVAPDGLERRGEDDASDVDFNET